MSFRKFSGGGALTTEFIGRKLIMYQCALVLDRIGHTNKMEEKV